MIRMQENPTSRLVTKYFYTHPFSFSFSFSFLGVCKLPIEVEECSRVVRSPREWFLSVSLSSYFELFVFLVVIVLQTHFSTCTKFEQHSIIIGIYFVFNFGVLS